MSMASPWAGYGAAVLLGACLGLVRMSGAPVSNEDTSRPVLWISAYYPGWQQHNLPAAGIDFGALTHLIHFSVLPQADGGLDWRKHDLDENHVAETVKRAHAAGRKILLCIGGADSAAAFRDVLTAKKRTGFVQMLVEAMQTHGYDGLDIDMEPMTAGDEEDYAAFIRDLRTEMRRRKPSSILTAAVGDLPALFAGLQDQFDQINVMTYDLSGAWDGWVTWHNSALWNNGWKFPGSERQLPGVDLKIREWLDAGVPPSKLGLGLAFYGYAWSGASGPRQSIARVTTRQVSYAELMKVYYRPEHKRWDEIAGVPYLGIEKKGDDSPVFVSYDDERSLRLKIEYAQRMKLGGAIIWELGSGYRSELPAKKRDLLLQAVHEAVSAGR